MPLLLDNVFLTSDVSLNGEGTATSSQRQGWYATLVVRPCLCLRVHIMNIIGCEIMSDIHNYVCVLCIQRFHLVGPILALPIAEFLLK